MAIDDQVELAKSLAMGDRGKVGIDRIPKSQRLIECTTQSAVDNGLARHLIMLLEPRWKSEAAQLT